MTWQDSYYLNNYNKIYGTTIDNATNVPIIKHVSMGGIVISKAIPQKNGGNATIGNISRNDSTMRGPQGNTNVKNEPKIENEKKNTRSPDTKDTLESIDLNMVARIAQDHGVIPHHLAGILKYENGGLHRQALASLWSIYSKEKADQISAWCNLRKKAGTYPEWVDCKREQSFGIAQINIWVHRSISIGQALDNEFSATWTAKRLIAKGYTTNKKLAIRLHNGFSESQANRNYADNVLSVARKITF